MSRIAIWSHAPSDTVNALKAHLEEQGHSVVKIRRNGSTFRGRRGDFILNYGSSEMPSAIIGQATVLNNPEIISRASNKLNAFRLFADADVKTVPWTADRATAESWLRDGKLVYARTTLQGHSGEGIVLAHNNPAGVGDAGNVQVVSTLPRASLFTQAILQERREYRIHVMKGKITYVQQKKRRDGYREIEGFSNLVRNYHTGWIYATQMAELNEEAKREAVKAITALGLDYGAVDVITRRNEAWVLEVNTAPGMTGTNLETFSENLVRMTQGFPPIEVAAPSVENLRQEIENESTTPAQPRGQRSGATAERATATPIPEPQRPAPSEPARTTTTRQQSTAQAAPAQAPTARGPRDSNGNALRNNGVYVIVVSGERTVGKFDSSLNHFETVGWEIPVELSDATVQEFLCVL